MFGRKKRTIAAQQERIAALEKQIETLTSDNKRLKERVIDVERRERGIGRALNEATAAADSMIANAQKKSAAILQDAQGECDALREKAGLALDDAYRSAREIVRAAEEENKQKQAEMQQQIEQYSALLGNYDAMVQEQLKAAEDGAKRYAELARSLHEAVPQLLGADGSPLPGLSKPENKDAAETEADAPDTEAHPLRAETGHESDAGDDQLWTVDRIAPDHSGDGSSNVDAIIDEILAATEDDA